MSGYQTSNPANFTNLPIYAQIAPNQKFGDVEINNLYILQSTNIQTGTFSNITTQSITSTTANILGNETVGGTLSVTGSSNLQGGLTTTTVGATTVNATNGNITTVTSSTVNSTNVTATNVTATNQVQGSTLVGTTSVTAPLVNSAQFTGSNASFGNLRAVNAAINNLTSTGVVQFNNATVLGNMTVGNSNILQMQDQIYNLQAAVNPVNSSAGAMNTQSYYGADTQPSQIYRSVGEDTISKHYYDAGGLSTENLQYLQLDSSSNIPSMIGSSVAPIMHQNTTGTYIFGTSNQQISFTGPYNSNGSNLQNTNRTTRREQWNLLQDLGLITSTGSFALAGYTGFNSAWGSGFTDPSGIWRNGTNGSSIYSNNNIIGASVESFHWYGNYGYIWRYDISTKQVIARSVVNMTKTLWGASNSNQWLNATITDGFLCNLGNDLFVTTINNTATYGLLVFDVNLNPKNMFQSTSYGSIGSNTPFVTPTNFGVQAASTWQIQQDQVRGQLMKKWSFSQLGTGVYTSLADGTAVNVFSGNTGSQATFIYVWSTSQASYASGDRTSIMNRASCVTPLSNAKWDTSCGKINVFALCTGAPASPTGVYASIDGYRLVPIMQYRTMPDEYVAGDTLSIHSFTMDPLTSTYNPLAFNYPLVDIRDSVVGASSTYRNVSTSSTGSWREGYTRFTFYTGSATGSRSAGKQRMVISICCITGGYTQSAYYADQTQAGTGSFYFPNNRRMFQDVYGQTYVQSTDGVGTFYQQNFYFNGAMTLSDLSVKFYPIAGAITTPQYIDTTTGIRYVQQSGGNYLSSPGSLVDPSPNAQLRQLILNNGFAVRYQLTSYNFLLPFQSFYADYSIPNASFTNNFNPQIPPSNDPLANVPAQPVFGTFDFPDGHAFDSTQFYVSDEWDLSWYNWRSGTGPGLFGLNSYTTPFASQYDTTYGNVLTLSATGVQDFFNKCQSALSSNVVRVLLPGDTYTGANNPTPQTVNPGKVVFQVLGEVFNGQPIKMTFNSNAAGTAVLSDWQAKQLNYYGGGIYGNPSVWQDSQGNSHLICGAGNLTSCPIYEMVDSGNYCARQFIADKQSGRLPVSATTLRLLGLDNIQTTPGTGPKKICHGVDTAIYNANGTIVFDCSLAGIFAFRSVLGWLAYELWAGQSLSTWTNILNGVTSTFNMDVTRSQYYLGIWNTNPYGERPTLTGQQKLECLALFEQLLNYHVRYMSNRRRAAICNNTSQINMKTMQVEQIIRGRINFNEMFSLNAGYWIPDYYQYDTSCFNTDEVDGAMTCGKYTFYQRGKLSQKMWSKTLAESANYLSYLACQNISNGSRTRFACSYDGILGQQIVSQTGSTGYSYSYGNVSNIHQLPTVVASLNSAGVMYLGVRGGKDVFGFYLFGGTSNTQANIGYDMNSVFSQVQNLVDPINGTNEPLLVPLRSKLSADGKAYVRNTTSGTSVPAKNSAQVAGGRTVTAVSLNDDGSSIETVFSTYINTPHRYELNVNTGAVGTFNTTSTFGSYSAPNLFFNQIYGGRGQLGNNQGFVVNDLIVVSQSDWLRFYRADNGDFLGQIVASDVMWDESYLPDTTNPTTNVMIQNAGNGAQETSAFGQMVYNNKNLYVVGGGYGRANSSSYGRQILNFKLLYNTPYAVNLTSLFVAAGSITPSTNSQTVVFTPQDALSQNGGLFCLLTTFKTTQVTNQVANVPKPEYGTADLDWDSLFISGVTAVAIYDPTNTVLSKYQAASYDLSTKFVNGGSWYQQTGITFKQLLASGVVKFLYAGQVPYKCGPQSPFVCSIDQIAEARVYRRQKQLLSEYYRAKGQVTVTDGGLQQLGPNAQLPDNGMFWNYNQRIWSSMKFKPYFNWATPTDATKAVIFNQSLGYTDVGTGRPLPTPL